MLHPDHVRTHTKHTANVPIGYTHGPHPLTTAWVRRCLGVGTAARPCPRARCCADPVKAEPEQSRAPQRRREREKRTQLQRMRLQAAATNTAANCQCEGLCGELDSPPRRQRSQKENLAQAPQEGGSDLSKGASPLGLATPLYGASRHGGNHPKPPLRWLGPIHSPLNGHHFDCGPPWACSNGGGRPSKGTFEKNAKFWPVLATCMHSKFGHTS